MKTAIVLLVSLMSLTGCSSLFNSTYKTVNVTSTSDRVLVSIDGIQKCYTPCKVEVSNRTSHTVTYTLPDGSEQTKIVSPFVGAGWVVLDVVSILVLVAATPQDDCDCKSKHTCHHPDDSGISFNWNEFDEEDFQYRPSKPAPVKVTPQATIVEQKKYTEVSRDVLKQRALDSLNECLRKNNYVYNDCKQTFSEYLSLF